MTLVANETLDLNATTFRTEAAKIVTAKPDVILTEALGPPEASFLSEVKQLQRRQDDSDHRHLSDDLAGLVQVGGGRRRRRARWRSSFQADNLVTETSGPAFAAFSKAMNAEKGKVGSTGNFSTYLTAPGAVHLYDGINLAALAMLAAKSTSPTVYMAYVLRRSATACRVRPSCTRSRQAPRRSRQGKQIRYEGPGGPTSFDAYHDSAGLFQINTYSAGGPGQSRPATSSDDRAREHSGSERPLSHRWT